MDDEPKEKLQITSSENGRKYITSGSVHMKLITSVDTKSLPVNPIKRNKVMERHKVPN